LTEGRSFVFTARDPLRYFAVVVSRFARVAERTVALAIDGTSSTDTAALTIAIDANPRQQGSGRDLTDDVEAIMRYYAGVVGDVPYASLTVALVEDELPGGHSPGYMAVLNNPLPTSRYVWRSIRPRTVVLPTVLVADMDDQALVPPGLARRRGCVS
ncbi:MAG: hypothetical protein ACRDRU_29870, partial [Pseudonocardiaceae bacterium]